MKSYGACKASLRRLLGIKLLGRAVAVLNMTNTPPAARNQKAVVDGGVFDEVQRSVKGKQPKTDRKAHEISA
jgi:hypothetical protein